MEDKLIGFCECCGIEIYQGDIYATISGELFCDYCAGDDGLAISEQNYTIEELREGYRIITGLDNDCELDDIQVFEYMTIALED